MGTACSMGLLCSVAGCSLRILTRALCAGQVPAGAESAGPADLALYDAVAKALLGERPDVQLPEAEDQLPKHEQLQRMLHYLVGTQLRRHLEKCAALPTHLLCLPLGSFATVLIP